MDIPSFLGSLLPEIAVSVVFTVLIIRLSTIYVNTILTLVNSYNALSDKYVGLLQQAYKECAERAKEQEQESAKALAKSREETFKALDEQRERYKSLFDDLSSSIKALSKSRSRVRKGN